MSVNIVVFLMLGTLPLRSVFAQDSVSEKPPTPQFQIVISDQNKEKPVKKAISDFTQLHSGLGDNFDEIAKTLPNLRGDELNKALERLERIAAEMERLNKHAAKLVDALNNQKPVPSVASDADPEAYKDKDGNADEELISKLLDVGIAGVCIYQPQYCAAAMLLARVLGLNLDNIKESTKALGSLNDAVQAGEVDATAAELIAKNVPGVSAEEVKAIMEGKAQPSAIVDKVRSQVKERLQAELQKLVNDSGVDKSKLEGLVSTVREATSAENLIELNTWLANPTAAERKAAVKLLSLLEISESAKQTVIQSLKKILQEKQ